MGTPRALGLAAVAVLGPLFLRWTNDRPFDAATLLRESLILALILAAVTLLMWRMERLKESHPRIVDVVLGASIGLLSAFVTAFGKGESMPTPGFVLYSVVTMSAGYALLIGLGRPAPNLWR